ncbi:MAG: DNRLRE domain-containing protein [Nanoarchaeota archaeon]|nr:DNRLRE domain-containing protein [Nanoarchaeota archaeon]
MEKRKVFLILLEITFLLMVIGFSLNYLKPTGSITGFAIFESQPNSTSSIDTYILNDTPSFNTNDETTLSVGKATGLKDLRGLLEFNVSSISANDTVTQAVLQLYLSSSNINPSNTHHNITIKVYRMTSQWNASIVNWTTNDTTNLWTSAGGDYNLTEINSSIVSNVSGWYNFTITILARGWVNQSYPNYGLILITTNTTNASEYKNFYSSESADPTTRPKLTITHVENAPPSITSITTNTNLTSPKNVGENVNFSINWTDLESNQAKIYICNSTNISSLGCSDKTFCNTSYSLISPIQCNYTISADENRTQKFWAIACDSVNCSDVSSANYFYVNHFPNITLISPNGGETINQTANGNYSIRFNISDADSDNLLANIYYGTNLSLAKTTIALNINLNNYCTDLDLNNATYNNCTYSWNTSSIYGNYSLQIIINDSFSTANDSSNSDFRVVSLDDQLPPSITAQWFDSYSIYSGKTVQIYANVSELNTPTVWVSINTTPQINLTMTNSSSLETYTINWTATQIGTYQFKVYANDIIGNLNNSMSWQEFNITKPNATGNTITAPAKALPYSLIRVSGELNATEELKGVYAYLNVPTGFMFLTDYPQNYSSGNYNLNQNKTINWVLSTPITEGIYALNITYTDNYSNTWNSSNTNLEITSAIGGYSLLLNGYPEVETAHNYYAEASFIQGGSYTNTDSTLISIYDSTGALVLGPASMNLKSTGIYNYTYAIGSSVNEGQWETRINATKSSTSYYANQFFKIVGGPFDVRNIVIVNSSINNMNISVITENTGGANKDLIINWNLTRQDNNQILDSGSETIMVNANSEKLYSISPSTTYVGAVRITFLGYYSGTEKAGAYKLFSTTTETATPPVTPPTTTSTTGGGGGGIIKEIISKKSDFTIQNFEKNIRIAKNIAKTISLEIYNNGDTDLNQISLELENLPSSYYTVIPISKENLKQKETRKILINFLVTNYEGELNFNYVVKTNQTTEKKEAIKILILGPKEFFIAELQTLREKLNNLKNETQTPELLVKFETCKNILTEFELETEKSNYDASQTKLDESNNCINQIEKQITEKKLAQKFSKYKYWAIMAGIITLIVVIILIFIMFFLHKKTSIADFIKKESKFPEDYEFIKSKNKDFDTRIKDIRKRMGA